MKPEAYDKYSDLETIDFNSYPSFSCTDSEEFGLAPGGLMRQEIYQDDYGFDVWDPVSTLTLFYASTQQPSVPDGHWK